VLRGGNKVTGSRPRSGVKVSTAAGDVVGMADEDGERGKTGEQTGERESPGQWATMVRGKRDSVELEVGPSEI